MEALARSQHLFLCASVGACFGGVGMFAGRFFDSPRHTCACEHSPILSVSNGLMVAGCVLGCWLVAQHQCGVRPRWQQHIAGAVFMLLAMQLLPNRGASPLTRDALMLLEMFAGHACGLALADVALRYWNQARHGSRRRST